MATDSADYYMLVNECAWSKSQVCLLRLEVDMGSVWSQSLDRNEIWCVKGMCMQKVV